MFHKVLHAVVITIQIAIQILNQAATVEVHVTPKTKDHIHIPAYLVLVTNINLLFLRYIPVEIDVILITPIFSVLCLIAK